MADQDEIRGGQDWAVRQGVLALVFVFTGFVILLLCAAALFSQCFRGLPYRFTMLGCGILPILLPIGLFPAAYARPGLGPFTLPLAILVCLTLSSLPPLLSIAALVRKVGLSRSRVITYVAVAALQLLGILWSLSVCWTVFAVLGAFHNV